MFGTNYTQVWKADEHLQATKQNLKLTLWSERGELLGDPYFGLMLKHYLFNQNNTILRDIIIDMIYTQVALFLPQLKIERKDIEIVQDLRKGQLICYITGRNQIDYTLNTYELVLFKSTE